MSEALLSFASGSSAEIPSGIICMWSGDSSTIPSGWALCNGSNGTPDLRDRFIVGAGNSYTVGATGGEATHTLTIDEIPVHSHTIGGYANTSQWTQPYVTFCGSYNSTKAETSSVGGGKSHENRPPYYALCFIMKT